MTKYEYEHNPKHEKIYRFKGNFYLYPIERIVLIILVNIAIICIPLSVYFNNWLLLIFLLVFASFSMIISKYNLFYNFERMQWFIYLIFSKETRYKEFLVYINEYENLVKLKQKMHAIKIRKSYLDCKKVICFTKTGKYILQENKVLFINESKITYVVPTIKSKNELINFYSEIIKNNN